MYDFGGPHIADAVEEACANGTFRELKLAMQPGESVGEGTKADDLRDDEVVERLQQSAGRQIRQRLDQDRPC